VNIETFRGDHERVAGLIQEAWSDNTDRPLFYSPEYLMSLFDYPGADLSLAPALYEGSEPLGFVAGFPRRVRYMGRESRIAVVTLLSVSPSHKNRGYGILIWSELVRRIRAAGFDGMVNYCVVGGAMDAMILGACRLLKLPVERVFTVRYLTCLLWPGSPGAASDGGRIDDFLSLAAGVADRVPLAQVWSPPEAEWQCRRRTGALVLGQESGSRRGMLTGQLVPVADPKRTVSLLIDDVLWGDLEPMERVDLVRRIKRDAAERGARLAVVPIQGYADQAAFLDAGFRPSGRTIHAYLSIWSHPMSGGPLDAMYMPVF
jgi:hypothetical protein